MKWNGKLVDNNYQGDSMATIVMELVMVPCGLIGLAGAVYWVYTLQPQGWVAVAYYLLAIVLGAIAGLFLAAAIGLLAVLIVVVFALAALPFIAGLRRLKSLVP